jgi:hypothetical protein
METRLVDAIDAAPWINELRRRVQHYGWRYVYQGRGVGEVEALRFKVRNLLPALLLHGLSFTHALLDGHGGIADYRALTLSPPPEQLLLLHQRPWDALRGGIRRETSRLLV